MYRLFVMSMTLSVSVTLACNPANFRYPPPHAKVTQGQLRGLWFTTRGGRLIAGFLGIPYAAPPVGPLRFRSPAPPRPWAGVYPALSEGAACLQRSLAAGLPLVPDSIGAEDCLYLNVFTPNVDPRAKLPVVVFIHGGYFEVGFSNTFLYGPDYLMDEDIVLVTINYRLGILGFLSLEHPVLPGNLGLRDQRAALRWVRDNIAGLGGDPRAVTLFGESAGAASVHFHAMFTAGEGLFRGGICNSGSALAPWALHPSRSQRSLVDLIVKHTGCPRSPAKVLVDCLRDLPAAQFQDLLHVARGSSGALMSRVAEIGPVMEPRGVPVYDALVTSNPWDTTTNLPLLMGVNQAEGLFWLADLEKDKTDKTFEEFNRNYTNILPYNLHFDYSMRNSSEVAINLKKFYLKNENIDRKHFNELVNLVSDGLFNFDVAEAARRNRNKTFFYQFNYRGSNSVVRYLGSAANYGVSHFDDMFYFFPIGGPWVRNETEADVSISKTMVKMWTNFIKYQDPTPDGLPTKWQPMTSASFKFLNISQQGFKMDVDFLKDRMGFWKSLSLQRRSKGLKQITG